MAYPVVYQADYKEQPSRLTTFFRYFLTIPWLIVSYFWILAATVCVVIAWFALIFTGRYPQGLYGFIAKYLRFNARITSWANLMTDEWPPFGGGENPEYPVRLAIGPPQAEYSRARVLFRIIVGIPVLFMHFVFSSFSRSLAAAAWFVIVFKGRLPKNLSDLMALSFRYEMLAVSYFFLVTETYPPLLPEDDSDGEAFPPPPPVESTRFGA